MNDMDQIKSSDNFKDFLISSRAKSSVTKYDIASLISGLRQNVLVFAFEGKDDKNAYYHWIKNSGHLIKYEAIICGCKRRVLKLFRDLESDQSGIRDKILFFIDRDFDLLQGEDPHDQIFMTNRYSIENYLVCQNSLDDILKIDFHCNGYPNTRNEVLSVFNELYKKFLDVARDINFRIYVAKALAIDRSTDLSDQINRFAMISLTDVNPIPHSLKEVVPLNTEPPEDIPEKIRTSFESLAPEKHYRGKYCLRFFIEWLKILRSDRNSEQPILFKGIPSPQLKISGDINFERVLTRSCCPPELEAFIKRHGVKHGSTEAAD